MAEDDRYAKLGKELADLGLSFNEFKKRIGKMPEENRKSLLLGFANTVMANKPDEAYLAARDANDTVTVRVATRKLLETSLRQASRIAQETDDADLIEAVIEEAEKRGDNILVEMMKRQLKEKKLRDISKEFGI